VESPLPASPALPRARLLTERNRPLAAALLRGDARRNLLLLDLVERLGEANAAFELPPQIFLAELGRQAVGVASLRPSVALASRMSDDVLRCLMPYIGALESGLVKGEHDGVSALWSRLRAHGRRALIDRVEYAHLLEPGSFRPAGMPEGTQLRPAATRDLDALVVAARASLREEGRPDPFDADPPGFRRWVRGRLQRARVAERDGKIVFVAYADVRRTDGWLVQGVYTWPEARRQGIAAAGMTGVVDEAFAAGAEHVQLAVIEGNDPALGLYERLGFVTFERLRTLLFT